MTAACLRSWALLRFCSASLRSGHCRSAAPRASAALVVRRSSVDQVDDPVDRSASATCELARRAAQRVTSNVGKDLGERPLQPFDGFVTDDPYERRGMID